MGTYNGSEYIYEQIESIRKQTLAVGEVIICDDKSTDNTYEIIASYINTYNLKNWILIRNLHNKGWQKNYKDLIDLANGDIIFFSDQDDIWLEEKVEEMVKIIEKNHNILLLSSGYSLIDRGGNFIQCPVFSGRKCNNTQSIRRIKFWGNYHFTSLGSVICFRKSILSMANQFWFEGFAHDLYVWVTADILDGIYCYDKVLTLHRIHGNNASGSASVLGTAGKGNIENRIRYMDFKIKVARYCEQLLRQNERINNKNRKQKVLRASRKCFENRKELLSKKSIWKWIMNLRYLNYYESFRVYLGDLVYILKNK